MIRGSFDRGRPQVECRLVVPRLRVNHRLMLLVDTGASATCLHPADAIRAGIPFELLGNRIDYLGIGGTSAYFRETANLVKGGAMKDHRGVAVQHKCQGEWPA